MPETKLYRLLRAIKHRLVGANLPPDLLAERYPDQQIGPFSYGDLQLPAYPGDARLRMGAYCSVAAGVQVLLGGEHRPDWVTTYPFPAKDPRFAAIPGHPRTKGDVVIGNDVWLGREAMILSGVTIGDGAVVGARALVTRDVPPYAIVAGNPGVVVRKRFDDATIARLLALRWWDWPAERVARAVPMMLDRDIAAFLDAAEAGRI
ncbi:antibiotic acetyltransferase [Sphingomonas changnyeongensis]|uniref:Antibiotic acetyltransferase n=1 Tax=Sphingomonas changnyeongensis TaxID=2698679 RepID=A0A7Z2NUT0_9SPHN|nr:CatB-related O-acetyltransferase [Sphingomonas changnyeongensis]QHL90112.1 antibiotic acetyltransferase [Sphingomonas changnyeongensis]